MATSIQPVNPEPVVDAAPMAHTTDNALDSTAELYARSELERRLERIEAMIEKAKQTS